MAQIGIHGVRSSTIYLGLNAMDYAVLHLRYELASILA
jgi:hypothetical protein